MGLLPLGFFDYFSAGTVFRRQNLTSKVDPGTERFNSKEWLLSFFSVILKANSSNCSLRKWAVTAHLESEQLLLFALLYILTNKGKQQ